MKLELSTEEIRAILTAHLRAQGLPIEPDAKVAFVAHDWGGDDDLPVVLLTATYEILETSPGKGLQELAKACFGSDWHNVTVTPEIVGPDGTVTIDDASPSVLGQVRLVE